MLRIDSSNRLHVNHANLDGNTILHIGTKQNHELLAKYLGGLLAHEADRKATTPSGDTLDSLAKNEIRAALGKTPVACGDHWSNFMKYVYGITKLTPTVEQELKQKIASCTDDPAQVTDDFESALTVARSKEVKNIIRAGILLRRRQEVFDDILTYYPQTTNGPTNLILQFAGTYEIEHLES